MLPRRILMFGATGTIGRTTVQALVRHGHTVVCFVRPRSAGRLPPGVETRDGDVRDATSVARDGFRGESFDAVVSCMASRTGEPTDAWAIDHLAHRHVLEAARAVGVTQMVLLSAICVQKPLLAFQQAKLAFEAELMASGLTWSIVRPTAFFKSQSGQVARVQVDPALRDEVVDALGAPGARPTHEPVHLDVLVEQVTGEQRSVLTRNS